MSGVLPARFGLLAILVLTGGAACGIFEDPGEALASTAGASTTAARGSSGAGEGAVFASELESEAMTGVLVTAAEVTLAAPGQARLESLDFEVGDHVDADELIAVLDIRGQRSDLSQATAAWRSAKAELERLELELDQARVQREDVEELEDYVSRAELAERRFAEQLAEARKRSAGASLQAERSKIDRAKRQLEAGELRAPFAGTVAARYVDAGTSLTTGEPIVRLVANERMLRFAVPEARSGVLGPGTGIRVRFEAPTGEAIELGGEVVSVAPEIDPGTRLILATARLEAAPALDKLRIGAVAQVSFGD